MNILRVHPQTDYVLGIDLEDGRSGSFDLKPYLDLEVFEPLRDFAEFDRVVNCVYFIEWPSGADLSADTIEARMIFDKANVLKRKY